MIQIKKGINLSHWLSQVFGWSPRKTFITKQDIEFIKNNGFDHVRIPIDEEELWDTNDIKKDEAFNYLHSCINWCLEADLCIVVDLHILRSHHFNNAAGNEGAMTLWESDEDQDKMMNIWRKLSAELSKYPIDRVAYEFMNEPVAPKHHQWNELVARGHKTIRELEKERVIIFGPNLWQIPKFFDVFDVPANDKNIILSFHTYDPLPFTHYTAPWVPFGKYSGPINYPGITIPDETLSDFLEHTKDSLIGKIASENRVFTKESFLEVIQPALIFAKKRGLQLYCNEFGCLPSVSRNQRLLYYTDIIDVFKTHNIAFASWDYKGDFGVKEWDRVNFTNGKTDIELIKILTT